MPTLSPQVTPYYGGGQVVNPANVILINDTPPTQLTEDKVGTIAVNNSQSQAYMLVSKTFGVNTWAQIADAAGFISSIHGTTNQIEVSVIGGSATLSFPTTGISIGSGASQTPPDGGLFSPGQIVIGSGSYVENNLFQINSNSGDAYAAYLTGNLTAVDGSANSFGVAMNIGLQPNPSSTTMAGYGVYPTFGTMEGNTTAQAFGLYVNAFPRDTNAGTITQAGQIFTGSGASGGGTTTSAYGGYFSAPVFGTSNNVSLYGDDISSGALGNGTSTKGTFRSAPPSSTTATAGFADFIYSTPFQNPLNYDVIVHAALNITSVTSSTMLCAVGPTGMETPNDITPLITAPTVVYCSVYVPAGYFVNFSSVGDAVTVIPNLFVTAV